jgi:hypothetical protein
MGQQPPVPDAKKNTSLQEAIERGLAYLHEHQYPNGEFCAYISGDDAMQGWCQPDSTIFPTALIASCLLHLKDRPGVEELLGPAADFLRAQMARGGTWNHFTNGHPLHSLCPMDADDTACVGHFLSARGVSFPRDQNTALLMRNRRSDGLFYTWFSFHRRLRPFFGKHHLALRLRALKNPVKTLLFWQKMECGPDDVDTVVNANVLHYLGSGPATGPIVAHLVRVLAEGREGDCDKWYRNPFTVYYFIARACAAGLVPAAGVASTIYTRILAKAAPDGRLGDTVLDTALAMCALMDLDEGGELLEKAAGFLLDNQEENGSWPRWRLYYGGPKKLTGYGSEELSTAFCLEALSRYASEMWRYSLL